MKIFDFIKSLLPTFGKSRLEEEATITKGELEKMVKPSYDNALPLVAMAKFNSKVSQDINNSFANKFKMERGQNIIGYLQKAMPKVIDFQAYVQGLIEAKFEKDIIVDGITIFKANVLQAQTTLTFFSRYAGKLLNYFYILETQAVNGDMSYVKDSLSTGDIKWLIDFCNALNVVSTNKKDLASSFDKIPDVIVRGNADALSGVYGPKDVDPLGMSVISGFSKSPIFSVRLMVAEYQVRRYKEAQETTRLLELRLLNLQRQNEKQPDAGIEREINYTQSRVDKFAHEMRTFEESVK
jgi:hypothetical protein